MHDYLFVVKAVLSVPLLAMFVYGLVSIPSGRVYCKGRWYRRDEGPSGFWLTIAIYLIGPLVILGLVWKAT